VTAHSLALTSQHKDDLFLEEKENSKMTTMSASVSVTEAQEYNVKKAVPYYPAIIFIMFGH